MHSRRWAFTLIATCALAPVWACQDEDSRTGDAGEPFDCPLGPGARTWVENTIFGLYTEAGLVANHARPREAAFVLAIPGTDLLLQNFAFLIDECRGPSSFVPYCVGDAPEPGTFFELNDLCIRVRCEEDDIYLYDMWLVARPNTNPAVLHPLSYATTEPAGAAISDPNPHLTWRVLTSTDAMASVSATVAWAVDLTPSAGGAAIDGDFEGLITSSRISGATEEEIDVILDIAFPRIAGTNQPPIVVQAIFGADRTITGDVRQNGTPLATMTFDLATEGTPIVFEWISPCR